MINLTSNEKKFLVKFNLACAPVFYNVFTNFPVAETTDALIAKCIVSGMLLVAPTLIVFAVILFVRTLGKAIEFLGVMIAHAFLREEYQEYKQQQKANHLNSKEIAN